MTHAELVKVSCKWLRKACFCELVYAERAGHGKERPDALGFTADGRAVLVEAKASKSDALVQQRNKPHHWHGGVGTERWLAMPAAIEAQVSSDPRFDPLYEGWGLVLFHSFHGLGEFEVRRAPAGSSGDPAVGYLVKRMLEEKRVRRAEQRVIEAAEVLAPLKWVDLRDPERMKAADALESAVRRLQAVRAKIRG